jgi:hypothetical protein
MTSIYYEILTVELNDGKIYPVRPLLMKLGDREKCLYDKGTGECVGTYDEENVAIKQVKHEQRSDDSIEEPEEDSDDAEAAECSTAECSTAECSTNDIIDKTIDGKIYLMEKDDVEKCLYDKGTGECVGRYDEENDAIKQLDESESDESESDESESDESESDESESDESESEFAMINREQLKKKLNDIRELEKKFYDSNVQLLKHSVRLYKLEEIIRKIGEGVRIHLGEDEEMFVNTILEKPCPLPLQHLSPYQIQFGWWW